MISNELQEIKRYLKDNLLPDDDVVHAIRAIGDIGDKKAIPFLLKLLKENKSSRPARDAIALSLGKLKANKAIPVIIKLIKYPANENNRGSLIYSLLNLDCKKYFLYFVEIVCFGNFECREMSFFIIEKYKSEITNTIKKKALAILKIQKEIYQLSKMEKEIVNILLYIQDTEQMLLNSFESSM